MRKFILTIVLLVFVDQIYALDKEVMCRLPRSGVIKNADWGLALRAQMKKECNASNFEKCTKKYEDAIESDYQKNITAMLKKFDENNLDEMQRILLRFMIDEEMYAAKTALFTGKSSEVVANQMYLDCTKNRGK